MKPSIKNTLKTLMPTVGLLAIVSWSQPIWAVNHSMIYQSKSSFGKNVFVSQGIEGEYGRYSKMRQGEKYNRVPTHIWRGFGVRNSLGMEILKFMQFSLSHSFMNTRSKGDSMENLHGSRFSADLKLVFAAPVGNLEVGGGAIASNYEYRDQLESANMVGSGAYVALGFNYFMSSRVSLFVSGKKFNENLIKNNGTTPIENIRIDTNGAAAGFSIWL